MKRIKYKCNMCLSEHSPETPLMGLDWKPVPAGSTIEARMDVADVTEADMHLCDTCLKAIEKLREAIRRMTPIQ